MTILGIDPGTTRMGYGVIKSSPKLEYVDCGVIGKDDVGLVDRLLYIGDELGKRISIHRPSLIGIEKVYFSKNKKTALSVSEARGVILFIAGKNNIPVLEFGPTDVKRVVAGDGSCSKETLSRVVSISLGVPKIPGYDDASDALAIAIRASFESMPISG